MRAGQETMAGIRSPPSSSSVFRPVKGHVSANRSPPLSLVKMTIVFSARPFALQRLQNAADLKIHFLDHALIGLLRAAVEIDAGCALTGGGSTPLRHPALPTASAAR